MSVFSELDSLFLSQNFLSAVPSELTELSSLRLLDISYNDIGVLPPEILAMQLTNTIILGEMRQAADL